MEIGVIFIIIHTNVGKTARDRPKPSVSHAKRKPTMLISFEWPMIFKTTTNVHVPHKRKRNYPAQKVVQQMVEQLVVLHGVGAGVSSVRATATPGTHTRTARVDAKCRVGSCSGCCVVGSGRVRVWVGSASGLVVFGSLLGRVG